MVSDDHLISLIFDIVLDVQKKINEYSITEDQKLIDSLHNDVTEISTKILSLEKQKAGVELMMKTYEASQDMKSVASVKTEVDEITHDIQKLKDLQTKVKGKYF